jgi:putative tricarboxylic transport membrane protein
MTQREKDRISTLFWLLIAIGICLGSLKLSFGSFQRPGAGFFSFLSGAILGILSLIDSGKSTNIFGDNPKKTIKMVYVIAALVIYTIGMNYIGFSLATILFLLYLLKTVEPQRWLVSLLVSFLGTGVAYGIFQYWLDCQLPRGIFGF